MHHAITQLLSGASRPITKLTGGTEFLAKWGSIGNEFAEMLTLRNGFYAYDSALLVRPLRNERAPLGVQEWNASELWKGEYKENLSGILFFAEDVFGGQYGICEDQICIFDPETGHVEVMSTSLGAWTSEVVSDYQFRTGYPLAHAWQLKEGPLPPGVRLLPKIPFVCGGKYEVNNLYPLEDVKGMMFRASIANQIRDLPDGAEIVLKFRA